MPSGKPIEIPIDINADGAEKGVSKVTDAFEEVTDSLKDLNKAGEKTSKELESDMSDAAKKIDRDLTTALEEVEDKAKSAGKTVGKSMKDGTDTGSEGLKNMRDEAASTAKESAASFGSIEDSADALQEIAANAFAGMGPAGMAAGILAAAGIGLAISALQDNAEKINENKEKMLDLAQTIRDNGGVLKEADYIAQMDEYGYAIQDTKEWFEIFQEDAISGFEKLRKAAEASGLSTKQIFEGGFGDSEKAKQTLDLVNQKLTETEERAEALYNLDGSIEPVDSRTISSLREYKEQVENNIKAQEVAKQIEEDRKRSIEGTTAALRENIEAVEKQTDALKGSITSELDYLDSVDALSGKLSESSNAWDVNTASGRENQRAVIDIANGIEEMAKASIDAGGSVDSVTAKFNAQRDALVAQVMPAFGGSRDAAQKYIDTILQTPPTVKTDVNVHGIPEAERQVNDFTNRPRTIPVHMAPDGTAVDNYIYSKQGTRIFVDFAPRGGVAITN